MCGIFGSYSKNLSDTRKNELLSALKCINHRGPDSFGFWTDPAHFLFLAHKRLAIIDLTPAGHQPMHSSSGRFVISFNGEIYNFKDLTKELNDLGVEIKGGSDTAVMLAAFETFGIENALTKFVGMFAFAVWDQKEKRLTLARDRAGEKPLYYGWAGQNFYFSSELSPITESASSTLTIDRTSLGHLLKFGYIPAPLSIYKEVYKLPQATFLSLTVEQLLERPVNFDCYAESNQISPVKYWNLSDCLSPDLISDHSEEQAVEHLEKLLTDSITGQMIADVPLGAFLSGGIDSSTIVALMQKVSSKLVKTFSIGFDRQTHNEAHYAKAVAEHLGTEHYELYVTEKDALDVIPKLPQMYSEPFGDSSQIPTYLVSKLTREKVTVSLSGDGGDEIFGGYDRYLWNQRLWNLMRFTPSFLRSALASLSSSLPTVELDKSLSNLNYLLPSRFKLKNAGSKMQRALSIGAVSSPEDLYLVMLGQRFDSAKIINNFRASRTYLDSTVSWANAKDLYTRLMWMDFQTYLPDDIFVKVDRASMAVSLETRAPFLDHRVLEYAFKLPIEMKIRNGKTKYILRKLLERYVPNRLIDRPKMGFGVPLGSWLAGELKDWANSLLSKDSLDKSGLLNSKLINEVWHSHQKGNYSNQYFLWHVLMFQAWYDNRVI